MTVRALVIGLGAIGQRHARNLRDLLGPELVLSALRSRRGGSVVTDQLVTGTGNPESDCNGGVFTDLAEALSVGPDLVLVCNPTSLHLQCARAAIEMGAAVFIEKPLSHDLAGVDDLVALANDRKAVVAVGCQLRFHPALLRLRQLLDREVLGRLIAAYVEQSEYLPSYHPYEDYRESYASRSELGGGVVLTQIHELDYVRWMFGVPRRVFAVGGRIGSLDIDVEDVASALLEFESGGLPVAVHVHLDYLQRPSRRTCRVVGEAGTIDVDLRAPSLTWSDSDGRTLERHDFPMFDRAQLFADEMRAFLASVRCQQLPAVTLEDAAATLRLAFALRDSMSSGLTVIPT